MTSLNDFTVTDNVTDVLAAQYNILLGSIMRANISNETTMSGTVTLADTDTAIQRLLCNGANRIVKLPAYAVSNHPFVIVNTTAATYTLDVQSNAGVSLLTTLLAAAGGTAFVVPDGTAGYKLVGGGSLQFNDGEGNPAALGTAADGTSTYAARRDHVHPFGASAALPFSDAEGDPADIGTTADGTSNYASRRDHVHGRGVLREVLTAARTYYVRASLGVVTISNASPAVCSKVAHGLSIGDPVVFSYARDRRAVTITAATPGVATLVGHGFVDGDPIILRTTGSLPHNLVSGTVYYVKRIDNDTFNLSVLASPLTAINTTALNNTFVNGSSTITESAAHGLVVGQIIRFAGTSVVNFSNGVDYYIRSTPLTTTMTVSATNDGAAITAGAVTTQGTLVQAGTHYVERASVMPTGVTEGTLYYVIAAGFGADAFEFSTAPGEAAVNTSTATKGAITAATGNDANDGKAQTRAGAFLTIQKALDSLCGIDHATYNVTVQVADSYYSEALQLNAHLGGGLITMTGNTTYPANVQLYNAAIVVTVNSGVWRVQGFLLSGGTGIVVYAGAFMYIIGNTDFGTLTVTQIQAFGGNVYAVANYVISGPSLAHYFPMNLGNIYATGITVTILGTPAWGIAFVYAYLLGLLNCPSNTWVGSATGPKYNIATNAAVQTSGGASYLPGNAAGSTATGGQYA